MQIMPNRPFRKSQFGKSLQSSAISVAMKKFIELPFPIIILDSVPSSHNLSTIWALYTTLWYFDFVARSEWPKVGIDCAFAGGVWGLGWACGDLTNVDGFKWKPMFFPRLSDFLFGHTVIQLMIFFRSFTGSTQQCLEFWKEDVCWNLVQAFGHGTRVKCFKTLKPYHPRTSKQSNTKKCWPLAANILTMAFCFLDIFSL